MSSDIHSAAWDLIPTARTQHRASWAAVSSFTSSAVCVAALAAMQPRFVARLTLALLRAILAVVVVPADLFAIIFCMIAIHTHVRAVSELKN